MNCDIIVAFSRAGMIPELRWALYANGLPDPVRRLRQAPLNRQSSSPFHGTGELLLLFVLTQFPWENRFTLFPELL